IEGSTCLPECHDKGTKRSPVEAEYGRGLHRVDAKAEVQATPTGIKAGVSRNVWTDYYSVLTYRLDAGSNVWRRNRTVTERVEGRGWKGRKHGGMEGRRASVDDNGRCYGPRLKLFGQPAQCANQYFEVRISVVQIQ